MNYFNKQQKEIMKDFFGIGIKRKPMCNKCEHKKKGCFTICEKYRRIPENVQKGCGCEKFSNKKECEINGYE